MKIVKYLQFAGNVAHIRSVVGINLNKIWIAWNSSITPAMALLIRLCRGNWYILHECYWRNPRIQFEHLNGNWNKFEMEW